MKLAVAVPAAGLLVLSLLKGPVAALDLDEWVPGLRLTPFYSSQVEYNTNVFQVPSGSQDDVIFKMIPGFLADYTAGPHSVSAGFRAEVLKYVTLTSQDTVNYFAVGQLRLDFPKTLFNLREDFKRTNDPPNTELTGPIESDTNVLAPEMEYRLTERFAVGTNFSWTYVHFDDFSIGQLLDRNEYIGGGSVYWKFQPKTDLRLTYNYGSKVFTSESDRDVTRHTVVLGLRGDLTAKISSTFRIGYETRIPGSSFQPGYSGLIGGGDWVFRPTDRTTLTITTDRSVQESSFGDVPFYLSTSGFLTLAQRFGARLTVNLQGGAGVNNYPSKQTLNGETKWRDDTFYSYGVGAEYAFREWLTVGAEYLHGARRSNFDTFNFSQDKFIGRVTLHF